MSRNAPFIRRDHRARLVICTGFALLGWALPAAESLTLQSAAPNARVVAVYNPLATAAFKAREDLVAEMVGRGITNLTGKATATDAWRSLVGTNDVVGLKIFSAPGRNTGTRPAVVAAVVKGLLAAGLPPSHIVIWDKHEADLRSAGYFALGERLGVRVAGAAEAGYDAKTFYDTALIGNLVYGDLEFGQKGEGVGRKSFVSKLVSQQLTKLINIAPTLNHNGAGTVGNLFSLAVGSVDNTWRFESEPARLTTAVPEIYALPVLGDRVVLNISDALICQYEGGQSSRLHYSEVLNEVRLSRDPVALDVLALKDLERSHSASGGEKSPAYLELYKNAALLELGVADLKNIEVLNLRLTNQGVTSTR